MYVCMCVRFRAFSSFNAFESNSTQEFILHSYCACILTKKSYYTCNCLQIIN